MKTAANCIHCHECTDNCAFLSKYNIDIGDTERLRDFLYHCFLCGRCTEVCPVGIDGRAIILDMRCEHILSGGRSEIEKDYKGLLSEKRDYRFRNWKHLSEGRVYFPGCNFPSLYPRTNSKIAGLLAEHGIGTVYDCCGKPVADLGLKADEDRIIEEIKGRLKAAKITELITACPNCRSFFEGRLGVSVISLYDILRELGLGNSIKSDAEIYVPCPDREEMKWVEEIRPFIDGCIRINRSVPCCGLGGGAIKYEKELVGGFARNLNESSAGQVYTYCASCVGSLKRNGAKLIDHVLPVILGTDEQPDIYKSFINRAITRFR